MRRMFIDGVANELDDLRRLGECEATAIYSYVLVTILGFTEWARYKDVWKDA